MNKLQSFFATVRAIPFWRFILTLAMIGGVGIGGHAIYGAAKGCAMKPDPPPSDNCVDTVETINMFSANKCLRGARMVIDAKDAPNQVRCVCNKSNEVRFDGGN